ncbi:MAG TPA: hypothetical protein VGP48_06475 [Stellaceae bacterium]|jgi:hypothetical protein|nr:hypothetical protein [Stellaceae bacterium]
MTDLDFSLRFDAKDHVLLIAIGTRLNKSIYMAAYDALKRFVATRERCSVILDMCAVTDFDLSTEFLREIGSMKPAVPVGMSRVAVAAQPAIYGSARIVQALRTGTLAPITVVRTIDEAYEFYGAAAADFVAVDPI